jgi:hypothetical protein
VTARSQKWVGAAGAVTFWVTTRAYGTRTVDVSIGVMDWRIR